MRCRVVGGAVAVSITTVDGGKTRVDESALDQLAASIRGDVLKPDDPRYGERPIYNAMHQHRPAIIVRCTGTADVVDAVTFARQRNLLVAVRGGGHSVAGLSSCDSGVVIDLTRMRGVDFDPVRASRESRAARCGVMSIARRRPPASSCLAASCRRRALPGSRSAAEKDGSAGNTD